MFLLFPTPAKSNKKFASANRFFKLSTIVRKIEFFQKRVKSFALFKIKRIKNTLYHIVIFQVMEYGVNALARPRIIINKSVWETSLGSCQHSCRNYVVEMKRYCQKHAHKQLVQSVTKLCHFSNRISEVLAKLAPFASFFLKCHECANITRAVKPGLQEPQLPVNTRFTAIFLPLRLPLSRFRLNIIIDLLSAFLCVFLPNNNH